MIISRIYAGLGNQLFQYAAGRALAERHGVAFKMDCRWFDLSIPGDTPRRYELNGFNVFSQKASPEDLKPFPFTQIPKRKLGRSLLPRLQLFLQKKRAYQSLLSYREPHFHFDTSYFDLPRHVYLVGYFQSERYFKPIEEKIRKEFAFTTDPNKENGRLLDQIEAGASISLHVRRGDYALDPRIQKYHGLCPLSYYHEAIRHIEERVENPHFYLFSDDMAWVKEHLPIRHLCTYVEKNQKAPSYEDLRLMSRCRHHILANSSFSWWGAWLSSRLDKIVIAPKRWTNVPIDISDLIPPSWTLL